MPRRRWPRRRCAWRTLARQRLRAVRAEPVTPVIDDRSVEAQLNGQGACPLASLQPFNSLQHELPAVTPGLAQGHRYVLLVGSCPTLPVSLQGSTPQTRENGHTGCRTGKRTGAALANVGYARVSTLDQDCNLQRHVAGFLQRYLARLPASWVSARGSSSGRLDPCGTRPVKPNRTASHIDGTMTLSLRDGLPLHIWPRRPP